MFGRRMLFVFTALCSSALLFGCSEDEKKPDNQGKVCEEGKFKCNEAELMKCTGNAWKSVEKCHSKDKCDAAAGVCKGDQSTGCTKDSFKCEGKNLMKCDGSGWKLEKTCTDNQTCNVDERACKDNKDNTEVPPPSCTVGAKRCEFVDKVGATYFDEDGVPVKIKLEKCVKDTDKPNDPLAAKWVLDTDCMAEGKICGSVGEGTEQSYACVPPATLCQDGQKVCGLTFEIEVSVDGNTGSGSLKEVPSVLVCEKNVYKKVTACPDGQVCDISEFACKAPADAAVCAGEDSSCSGNSVVKCKEGKWDAASAEECGKGTRCIATTKPGSSKATCMAPDGGVCSTPDAHKKPFCYNNAVYKCPDPSNPSAETAIERCGEGQVCIDEKNGVAAHCGEAR